MVVQKEGRGTSSSAGMAAVSSAYDLWTVVDLSWPSHGAERRLGDEERVLEAVRRWDDCCGGSGRVWLKYESMTSCKKRMASRKKRRKVDYLSGPLTDKVSSSPKADDFLASTLVKILLDTFSLLMRVLTWNTVFSA